MSKTLSITALENVSIGKLLLRFSTQKVLHLLDFLPCEVQELFPSPILHSPPIQNQLQVSQPPSVGRQTPLMYLASSEQR